MTNNAFGARNVTHYSNPASSPINYGNAAFSSSGRYGFAVLSGYGIEFDAA